MHQSDARRSAARPLRRLAMLVVVAIALATPAVAQEPRQQQPPSRVTPSRVTPAVTSAGQVHAAPQRAPAQSAGEVRHALERMLGHHAILMVRRMRGPIDGETAFVESAQAVLDRNTDELAAAVQQAYDAPTAQAFRDLWQEHIDSLVAYGDALAQDDAAGQQQAREALQGYAARYGALIEQATGGALPRAKVAANVGAHIQRLLEQADAYATGDYAAAFRIEREAYAAMFSTGKALAGAVVRQPSGELPAGFDSPPEQLRSALGLLLGEHVELAFDATRGIVTGGASTEEAAKALDGNTKDIISAMQAVLGPAPARQFSEVWGRHIDALVDFSVALADRDDAAQAEARARIERFPSSLTGLLSGLAGRGVSPRAVVAAIRKHDLQLLQQVTAFAAGDFERSQQIAYDGYDHMFAIADTLARALEVRAAQQAPKGGAATGGGWLALRP